MRARCATSRAHARRKGRSSRPARRPRSQRLRQADRHAPRETTIRTLSSKPDGLKPTYDAIVVGSGYGAGVAACRLARAGLKVAVLERGREWRPGEFPRTSLDLVRAFRFRAGSIDKGSPLALFDYRVNKDVDVMCGSGLGGTSLINANVCLKPDPRVFEDATWPQALREDGTLAEGYARARAVLRPLPCPDEVALLKLDALALSAGALGAGMTRVPVHIAFAEGRNYANVTQPACTQCGDCCGGCNVGAKSTVALTYLADAAAHGAELFTRCEVRAVTLARDGRWSVACRWQEGDGAAAAHAGTTDAGSKRKRAPREHVVTAPIVVLGAGSLGSTEILLRSRERGLELSDQIGRRFTANGDSLAVAYNGEVEVNNIGVGHPPRAATPPVGPAVAGLIDLRASRELKDAVALVEAALPSAMAALAPAMLAAGHLPFGQDQDRGIADELGEALRGLESMFGGAYRGATRNSQTLLGVGHDSADGRLVLDDDDRLRIDWPDAGRHPVFQRIAEDFATAAGAIGASLIPNPMSLPGLGAKITTVHPLGGCAMAEDRHSGVVDHKCRVFDGRGSATPFNTYRGLYVCDGAVMPRSLGVHPLFTITAIAERAMIHLGADHGLQFSTAENTHGPSIYADAEPRAARGDFFAWLRALFSGGARPGGSAS